MAQNTVDDYLNYKSKVNNEPETGIAPGSNPIFSPFGRSNTGTLGGIVNPTNSPLVNYRNSDVDAKGNITGQKTRIGDYVFDSRGRKYLVPNSPTDIMKKATVVSGGYKQPTVGGASLEGMKTGATVGASAGATIGNALGPVGAFVGGIIGGAAGGILGAGIGQRAEYDAAMANWRKQNVNYETAVDFYEDEDGKLKYKFNFAKMAEGGELSSPDVLKLQEQATSAYIDDNGVLHVNVSPIFAQSDYYQSIIDDISKGYAGLTNGSPDYNTAIAEITDYIDSARRNYLANTVSYAAYKAMYPEASPAAIIAGYTTSFAGNADPKDMADYTVYTVNDGNIVETNAKDYFDNVYNMDKDQRNEYVKSIMELIVNPSADQDEKAVAYGDLQALSAVSANKFKYKNPDNENEQSKYQGMLNADWLVTFWAQFQLLDNLFLWNGRQEYLVQDESAKIAGSFASAGLNTAATIGGIVAAGDIIKTTKWGKALYDASKAGEVGQKTILAAAAGTNSVKGLIKVGAAGLAFNTIRSTLFNAARSGVRLLTGDKFEEVAAQFGIDVAIDTVIGIFMEAYDTVKFKATVEDTVQFVYHDKETGNIKILQTDAGEGFVNTEGGATSTYQKIGQFADMKTSEGKPIGFVKGKDMTVYRYGDQLFVVGADGRAAQFADIAVDPDGNILGTPQGTSFPKALKSGVVEEAPANVDVRSGLKAAGLEDTTEVFMMPSKDAYSAAAAGKFLKVDSSKLGMKISEQAFNSNAALDYVNNRALARTGNRTAWQNANEVFANMQQLSNNIRGDINNGVYRNPITGVNVSETVRLSREAYVKFREETFASQFGKMTEKDSLYVKAKESIARAQLAQKDIDPKSGIDLVAEAIAKNGKYIEGMPQDRADALDEYVALNKRYLNDYIMAVKNSGLLDIKLLNNVVNSDISRKLGYIPMWGKKQTYNNLLNEYFLVNQEKMPVKSWNRAGETVDVKDIMDFAVSTDYITDMFATNMAQSYTNMVLAEQLQDAGMLIDNRRTSEGERRKLLMRVENYDTLRKEMKKRIADTKKFVEENVPTIGQYKQMMTDIYDNGGIDDAIGLCETISDDYEIEYEEEDEDEFEAGNNTWTAIQEIANAKIAGEVVDATEEGTLGAQSIDPFEPTSKFNLKSDNKAPYSYAEKNSPIAGVRENIGSLTSWLAQSSTEAELNEKLAQVPEEVLSIAKNDNNVARLLQNYTPESAYARLGVDYPISSQRIDYAYANYLFNQAQIDAKSPSVASVADTEAAQKFIEANDNVKSIRQYIKQREADLKDLTNPKLDYKTDPIKDIASMSYDERLDLARRVQMNHRRADGLDEYILLYRVQKGKPDKWRANSRGYKGQFMSGPKGALPDTEGMVWMTADREWAEGPDRATAGVPSKWTGEKGEEISNENIVVLPIKRSDIVNNIMNGGEMEKSKKALTDVMKKNNAKIVQTRGIDGGLKQSEFVFWKDDNPEIFEDGMKLMMDEYNKELEEETQRVLSHRSTIRRADGIKSELNLNKKELANLLKERYVAATGLAVDNIITKASDAIREVAKYNEKFGRTVDAEAYIETTLAPAIKQAIQTNDMDAARSAVANGMIDVAPYTGRNSVMKSNLETVANDWRKWAEKNIKVSGRAGKETNKRAVDAVAAEINGDTVDGYEMGVANQAIVKGETYPFHYYKNGRPYTRYIKATTDSEKMVAEKIIDIITDKKLVERAGVIKRTAHATANWFRLLTSGMDPSRIMPNLARDTVRSEVTSGGVNYTARGTKQIFDAMVDSSDLTADQKKMMRASFENCVNRVGNANYNAAYGTPRNAAKALRHEYYQNAKDNAPNRLVKFTYGLKELGYDIAHDKRAIFEAPGDFFESLTRKRMARSSFINAWQEAIIQGKDFNNQLEAAEAAASFAGNEFTANFGRKGKAVGEISRYAAYFSTNFANIDGFKRAYINDPRGVSRNFTVFLLAYLYILATSLSDDDTRKTYYRLSDYDRSNSVIVPVGNGAIITIPLDETLASLMFPFRRVLETMNNVDPVSFYEFVWGTLTEPLPLDFSGFSEGDYFNFRRGIEKLLAQGAPDILKNGLEITTGYDLYYGSSSKVSAEDLKSMGIYDPEPGDYTTNGKNSATLRKVANATGIPQWQLQSVISNFGSSVGQYALYWIDCLSGATEEERGGKDFMNAVFKSFLTTDYDNVSSQFYTVINDLKQEKNKLLQKLVNLNEKMKTATGEELYKYQQEAQKARDDYGTLVGDAVGQYLRAYNITGGLSKSQAMQVYYLFNLEDDDSVYQYGSVGDYYNNQANQQSLNEATDMGAAVLDKYFNQSDRPYRDKNGNWRIAPSYSENAYNNTIYGQGMSYEVALRNLLDGKDSSLSDRKREAKNLRSAAANAKNWDLYNQIIYEYDKEVLNRIADFVFQYGAERVLTNTTALDYLEDWILVPTNWMTNKKGRSVSLGHDASKERAFARPYIKYLFGLDTGTSAIYDESKANLNIKGQ